jgi:biotin synthase
MSDEMQALCFMAGANSIFYGEKLLTTGNPDVDKDRRLLTRLGLTPEAPPEPAPVPAPAAVHLHA